LDDLGAEDGATLLFAIRDNPVLCIRKKHGLGAGKINGPGGLGLGVRSSIIYYI
jgi:8-oxo-dGTP diphosphatase